MFYQIEKLNEARLPPQRVLETNLPHQKDRAVRSTQMASQSQPMSSSYSKKSFIFDGNKSARSNNADSGNFVKNILEHARQEKIIEVNY